MLGLKKKSVLIKTGKWHRYCFEKAKKYEKKVKKIREWG